MNDQSGNRKARRFLPKDGAVVLQTPALRCLLHYRSGVDYSAPYCGPLCEAIKSSAIGQARPRRRAKSLFLLPSKLPSKWLAWPQRQSRSSHEGNQSYSVSLHDVAVEMAAQLPIGLFYLANFRCSTPMSWCWRWRWCRCQSWRRQPTVRGSHIDPSLRRKQLQPGDAALQKPRASKSEYHRRQRRLALHYHRRW
jgi:hypothetical protein